MMLSNSERAEGGWNRRYISFATFSGPGEKIVDHTSVISPGRVG
jgi:hypothetical protein